MGSRLLLVLLLAASGSAAAQARRCVSGDGTPVFTDKDCAAIGARDIIAAIPGPSQVYRNGCVRSLREFTYELSSAIEAGDVNRLAALYRWNGTSTRTGYALMDRLEDIASRPLLGILPVYPRSDDPLADALTADPVAVDPGDPAGGAIAPESEPLSLEPPRRGPPVALRLDQTLANGITPAPTTLRLQRDAGCWWVNL